MDVLAAVYAGEALFSFRDSRLASLPIEGDTIALDPTLAARPSLSRELEPNVYGKTIAHAELR